MYVCMYVLIYLLDQQNKTLQQTQSRSFCFKVADQYGPQNHDRLKPSHANNQDVIFSALLSFTILEPSSSRVASFV